MLGGIDLGVLGKAVVIVLAFAIPVYSVAMTMWYGLKDGDFRELLSGFFWFLLFGFCILVAMFSL